MERLTHSHAVDLHWRSFELRPPGSPPLPADYRARIESTRPRLYVMAQQQYGLALNPGPVEFNSRPALIGAKYAERMGVGPAYHDAVMRAHWQHAQPIADRTVLADIAETIGLERAAFLAALDDPALEQAVLADVAQAQAYGLSGVPAMVFADKYLVSGVQPYEVLVQVMEQLANEA